MLEAWLVGNENRYRNNDSKELRKLRLLLMMKHSQSKSRKLAQTMSVSLLLNRDTAQLKLFGYIVN